MARLPSGQFLIQQVDEEVILFEEMTEREIARFDISNADSLFKGQTAIANADLSVEDVAFAHFWSGYFYAHERLDAPLDGIEELTLEYLRDKIIREYLNSILKRQQVVDEAHEPPNLGSPGPDHDNLREW